MYCIADILELKLPANDNSHMSLMRREATWSHIDRLFSSIDELRIESGTDCRHSITTSGDCSDGKERIRFLDSCFVIASNRETYKNGSFGRYQPVYCHSNSTTLHMKFLPTMNQVTSKIFYFFLS